MKKLIKIITGFRDDQFMIIDAEEAHKAYYLFLHPEERAIFGNGVALIGKNIQEIVPAWNETMGWNPSHKLENNDWNEIRSKGVDKKLNGVLQLAKEVSYTMENDRTLGNKKLSELERKPSGEMLEISEMTKMLLNKISV